MPRRTVLILALFMCWQSNISHSASSESTAIVNVTLVDALNGIRKNQTVVFREDSITSIRKYSGIPEIASVLDGTGKFLIPGLWDLHVHLTNTDDEYLKEKMPSLFLSFGVTSVRDTGGAIEKMLPAVKKMRAKGSIAPRVFISGPLLDGNTIVYERAVKNSDPKTARQSVELLESQGVDFIKIYELVSPDVFYALVKTAREHKLPIAAHVPLSMRARVAGKHVDSMEHLRNIELDCAKNNEDLLTERRALLKNENGLSGFALRTMIHNLLRLPAIENYSPTECAKTLEAISDTLQVPTLRLNSGLVDLAYNRSDWAEAFSKLPAQTQKNWQKHIDDEIVLSYLNQKFAEWSLFLVGLMKEKQIPIGAGTDTPLALAIPGYSLHAELEMLVRAGLTPLEAIAAATIAPARYFSLLEELGSIDVGKRADMVLLDRNPMNNISNTKSISHVISRGRIFAKEDF